MIRAILWDFDGTLIDSESHHMQAELETFKKFGAVVTKEHNRTYQGRQITEQVAEIITDFNLPHSVEDILTHHREVIKQYAKRVLPLVPHAKETLKTLSTKYVMALVTSGEKEIVDILLDRFKLRSYFKAIVCAEDVTQGKPHPEPFKKAATLLGVQPAEAIVVEDAVNGITAAKKAGMKVILKKHTGNTHIDESLADFSVDDLKDIPHILEKL